MKHIMDVVNAGVLFTIIGLLVIAMLIAAGLLYLFFFYFQPSDEPRRREHKRVKTLFRAKGPAQTRIRNARVVNVEHPQAYGDVPHVTRAVYPREPMGV